MPSAFPLVAEKQQRPSCLTFRVKLACIATLGLLVRLGYVIFVERNTPLSGDEFYYHQAARLIVDGLGFTEPYRYLYGGEQELLLVADPSQAVRTANSDLPVGHIEPTAGHPPLWVLFLSGVTLVGLKSIFSQQLVGALIGASGVLAVGWAGKQMSNPRTGLLAASLAAGYAFLWLNDGLLMSESLVIVLTASAIGIAIRFNRTPSWFWGVSLGLVGGLAALTRAELLLALPLLALPILRKEGFSYIQRFRLYAGVGIVALAVLSPWVVRNITSFEEPVLLSNGSGILLAQTNCDETYFGDKKGYWEYLCGLPQPVGPDGQPVDEATRDAEYRQRGLKYASQHWAHLVTHAAPRRVARLWGVYAPIDQLRADKLVEGRSYPISMLGYFQYWVLIPLAIAGAIHLRRSGKPLLPIMIWPSLATLIALLAMGATRYRVPAEVSLVLLAGALLDHVFERRRKLTRKSSLETVEP